MYLKTIFVAALLAIGVHLQAQSTPDSVTIPLVLEPLTDGTYKLGIYVSLGGGPSQLYEFDTGGTGFYAANNTTWWSNFTTINPNEFTQTYATGISYNATLVSTTVDLGNGLPIITANMGQIQSASGNDVLNWSTKVADGIPPLWDHFFGDFGADLSDAHGIFGMLPQLPGNLSNGFIVRTGGFANAHPMLQIGISDADRALFPYSAAMQGIDNTTLFPSSNLPTFHGPLISGNASFSNNSANTSFSSSFIVDTGAPSMLIFEDNSTVKLPDAFLDGNMVIGGLNATFGSGNFSMAFGTGNVSGLSLVNVEPDSAGTVNTGLIPFFQYDIMFDVQEHEVRFAPVTVPEPGAAALLVGLVVGGAALRASRRRGEAG